MQNSAKTKTLFYVLQFGFELCERFLGHWKFSDGLLMKENLQNNKKTLLYGKAK